MRLAKHSYLAVCSLQIAYSRETNNVSLHPTAIKAGFHKTVHGVSFAEFHLLSATRVRPFISALA